MSIDHFVSRFWRVASIIAFGITLLFTYRGLPDPTAVHFGESGRGDGFLPKEEIFYLLASVVTFINVLISTIGFGIFGMILGLLFRSPISAISIGVIWNLIIEGLLSVFIESLTKYFPGQLLSVVAQGGTKDISYTYALVTSYGILLSGLVIVAILFKRRDVSN